MPWRPQLNFSPMETAGELSDGLRGMMHRIEQRRLAKKAVKDEAAKDETGMAPKPVPREAHLQPPPSFPPSDWPVS